MASLRRTAQRQSQRQIVRNSISKLLSYSCASLVALGLLALLLFILQRNTSLKSNKPNSKSPLMVDKKMEENIAQFCGVTGASTRDARKFLERYKRVDIAIDAYYSDPNVFSSTMRRDTSAPSTSKLHTLYNKYKDVNSDEIRAEGTIKFCEDLGVDPEDVVLLAVAYELKSPRMGEWNKQGWTDGWKNLGCDTIPAMQSTLPRLKDKLASDPSYFRKVYNHSFDFARSEGQRSLGSETAQALWALLLPHGMKRGAVRHTHEKDGEDVRMDSDGGWKLEYLRWWFEFLNEKGAKGISKDTWQMFLDFVTSINSTFTNYDMDAAWPSTIDDFVEWAKPRVTSGV